MQGPGVERMDTTWGTPASDELTLPPVERRLADALNEVRRALDAAAPEDRAFVLDHLEELARALEARREG